MTLTVTPLRTPSPSSAALNCCSPISGHVISRDEAADLARVMKALADPARLRLLSIVASHEDGEVCVCDLMDPVGLSQATVSYHLKMLTDAGFLARTKRGSWAYYRVVPEALMAVASALVR
jgi:ArsR family transcriptional regulator